MVDRRLIAHDDVGLGQFGTDQPCTPANTPYSCTRDDRDRTITWVFK
jgi:hypothetical protein